MFTPAPNASASAFSTAIASHPKTTFVEFLPGRSEHITTSAPAPTNIDIRKEPSRVRHALLRGPLVLIHINSYQICTIPLPLLQTTSTRVASLLYNGTINLPPDTDPTGVMILIQHLVDTARSKKPRRV